MKNNDALAPLFQGSRPGTHCTGGSCLLSCPALACGGSWQCVPGLEPWNEEGCDE